MRRDRPQVGQGAGESDHGVELLLVAPLPPPWVVEVLPTVPGIGSNRLEMAVRERTDPDVRPGRWDRELADPLQRVPVADSVAVRIDVAEGSSLPQSVQARPRAIGTTQPCASAALRARTWAHPPRAVGYPSPRIRFISQGSEPRLGPRFPV